MSPYFVRPDQVVGQFAVEREQAVDQRRDVMGSEPDRPGGPAYDRPASWNLVASASTRASGSRPSRRPCSAISVPAKAWYVETTGSPAPQSPSSGVAAQVRGENRVLVARQGRPEHAGLGEVVADPYVELVGRLLGEGQPEHLLRLHLPGADQPHHPGSHRRRLPRPGSRHNHPRRQRSRNRLQLLIAERNPQQLAQLSRPVQLRAHQTISRPSGWMGHMPRTSQRSQP